MYISVGIGAAGAVLSFVRKRKNLGVENQALKKAWEESEARLQNVEYAKMLKNAGIKVPSKYLNQNS